MAFSEDETRECQVLIERLALAINEFLVESPIAIEVQEKLNALGWAADLTLDASLMRKTVKDAMRSAQQAREILVKAAREERAARSDATPAANLTDADKKFLNDFHISFGEESHD
jgi:hypothetical protein